MGRTRTIYLETREDRNAIRKADEEEFGKRTAMGRTSQPEHVEEPEFESIESYVQSLLDDEETVFTLEAVQKLQVNLQLSPCKIIAALTDYGLKFEGRKHEKAIRGFTSNSHNLYEGNPMAGGSGIEVHGVGHRFHGA